MEEPAAEEKDGPSPRQEKKSEKAPKKKKEVQPQPFESDVKEYIKQIEELQTRVKESQGKVK
jgi:CO dehydrogenase/acetyl-CoA synthase delta subunit